MKTALLIGLSVILLLSLGANGFLVYQNRRQSDGANKAATQASLQRQQLAQQLTQGVATATSGIQTAQAKSDDLNRAVGTLTSDRYQLLAEKDRLSRQVQRVMCPHTIPLSAVTDVSSNAALVEPITKAVEQNWGFSSIDTSYKTLWNNSKTAVFDILDQDRASVKVVVSWNRDASKIDGIYDVAGTCYLHLP
ncbi:MAG TPA: hypothetical protein VF784_12110 [Anaerolineales bacterium]